MASTDELVPSSEAMQILGFKSAASISRLVASGRLTPARKLPGLRGAYLFIRADVERLARERAA